MWRSCEASPSAHSAKGGRGNPARASEQDWVPAFAGTSVVESLAARAYGFGARNAVSTKSIS